MTRGAGGGGGRGGLWLSRGGGSSARGRAPPGGGNRHARVTPYDPSATADGYVNVAIGTPILVGIPSGSPVRLIIPDIPWTMMS